MPGLRLHAVTQLADILAVRRLRNSGREFMTNSTAHIGVLKQIAWYFRCYRRDCRTGKFRLYLLRDRTGCPVGYGALRADADGLLVTECVATQHRGKGYGRHILSAMIQMAEDEGKHLLAEIFSTNQPSIALHSKAGFARVAAVESHGHCVELYEKTVRGGGVAPRTDSLNAGDGGPARWGTSAADPTVERPPILNAARAREAQLLERYAAVRFTGPLGLAFLKMRDFLQRGGRSSGPTGS